MQEARKVKLDEERAEAKKLRDEMLASSRAQTEHNAAMLLHSEAMKDISEQQTGVLERALTAIEGMQADGREKSLPDNLEIESLEDWLASQGVCCIMPDSSFRFVGKACTHEPACTL